MEKSRFVSLYPFFSGRSRWEEVGKFRNKISEQMKGLEMDLTVNETHIKKQNKHIESIQEEIKEVLERLLVFVFSSAAGSGSGT